MPAPLKVAVVGSGISGLSAAWLLSNRHEVTLFERDSYVGGHSNTFDVPGQKGGTPVDTGFIVYNPPSYPNLVALFDHLGVPKAPSNMSFAVSLDRGNYEYSGTGLSGVFGQPSNLLRPSHYRMVWDILRFFREAKEVLAGQHDECQTLGAFLDQRGYSRAFAERHILPMAAAIWSTPSEQVLQFPIASFIRFFDNHGLLRAYGQTEWRTVVGGSRTYVRLMRETMRGSVRLSSGVGRINRNHDGVEISHAGGKDKFDACVIATHADEALAMLADPSARERELLRAFRYQSNLAVLHRDASMMPHRRRIWSSWNYLGEGDGLHRKLSLTYWMNNLQPLGDDCGDVFVTLNPLHEVPVDKQIASFSYTHPMFDPKAMAARGELWSLQGRRRTWYCGAYFGYGFHEDGLQAGLAAAEDIGGVRRPWSVANESGRIFANAQAGVTSILQEAAE